MYFLLFSNFVAFESDNVRSTLKVCEKFIQFYFIFNLWFLCSNFFILQDSLFEVCTIIEIYPKLANWLAYRSSKCFIAFLFLSLWIFDHFFKLTDLIRHKILVLKLFFEYVISLSSSKVLLFWGNGYSFFPFHLWWG